MRRLLKALYSVGNTRQKEVEKLERTNWTVEQDRLKGKVAE